MFFLFPAQAQIPSGVKGEGMWEFLYQISASDSINPVSNLGLAAISFNGKEYWVAEWNTNVFHRLNVAGQKLQSFTIPDQNGNAIVGTRGIAWDGNHFYLSNNSNTIYQVDTLNRQTQAIINAPDQVRTLTFDPDAANGQGGFWIGNWGPPGPDDGPLMQIDMSGNTLRQIPASVHRLSGNYGLAYDSSSPGGPYLWVSDQSGSGASIVQIDLSDGSPMNNRKDINALLGTFGAAGGIFIADDHPDYPNQRVLGGLIQEDPDLIYGLELDFELLQIDALVSDVRPNSAYSIIPLNHLPPLELPIRVKNQGVADIDSLSIQLQVEREDSMIFVASYVTAGPNALDSISFLLPPYPVPSRGDFAFIVDVLPYPQADQDSSNNQFVYHLSLSDSVYARDYDELSGSLGIGAGPGQNSILGQVYETQETDFMTSISFFLENPPAGDQVYASVFNLDSADVPDLLLSNTVSYTITDQDEAQGVWLTLPFINGPLGMPADKYFVGINETNSNISLGTNDAGYAPGISWVYWDGSPAGGWANNEDFGFLTAYKIRPNFGPCAPVYLSGSLQQAGTSLTALPQGGRAPYTYLWNDSLLQNTQTAYKLPVARVYQVQITDANGCIAYLTSDTLQTNPTALALQKLTHHWRLYPNPARNTLYWEADWKTETSGSWEVRSIYGQSLQRQTFARSDYHQLKIDLEGLAAGIYLFEIRLGEHRFTERFVKE
ncbi:MAG: T9SS type A sorting domain-containing protein [Bacteroidota bacterium]